MDGTIVDSTAAIIKHWQKIGKQLGVDPEVILKTSHGRRSIDTLEMYDAKLANWEYVSQIEGAIPTEFGQDASEVPGSRALLHQLETVGVPWMIVTSGTRPLVTGWLDVMKLTHPQKLVTAEDVTKGKPDPACYLLGRSRLSLGTTNAILVLEDSPAGVRAGKNAGFRVVALATTHTVEQLQEAGADWIIRDMRDITLLNWDSQSRRAEIQITNARVR